MAVRSRWLTCLPDPPVLARRGKAMLFLEPCHRVACEQFVILMIT
jgi:hypothetical protein